MENKKCEICNGRGLEVHHIVSKSLCKDKRQVNKAHNKCLLCANCHTLVHKSEIIIEGKFLTDDGYQLIWHKAGEESITGMESDLVYIQGKKYK